MQNSNKLKAEKGGLLLSYIKPICCKTILNKRHGQLVMDLYLVLYHYIERKVVIPRILITIYHKTGKLCKKVIATDIFGSYAFQNFFYTISQFGSYFDNLEIVILTFTNHFHEDQFTTTTRLTRFPSSTNFI